MTNETLQRANEIDLEINVTRSLRSALLKNKNFTLVIEVCNDNNVNGYGRFETRLCDWMVNAMKRAAKEHEMELLQELDAL